MNRFSGKRIPPEHSNDSTGTQQRRRIGQVVHDERGSALVEWHDAPENYERPVLALEDDSAGTRGDPKLRRGFEPKLSVRNDDTFNPYDRKPDKFGAGPPPGAKGAKRDLRKLSEWVKMMRTLEERKKNGESD